jgi:opacity protein-like surface antigen
MKLMVLVLATAALAVSNGAAAQTNLLPSDPLHLGSVEYSYAQVNLGVAFAGQGKFQLNAPAYGNYTARQGLEPHMAVSALVGTSYTSGISFEGEGVYFANNYTAAPASSLAPNAGAANIQGGGGFANVKYEHVNAGPFFPYVAGGIGYGGVQYDVFGNHAFQDGMMWQLKAGVAIPVSTHLTWDLGYRFLRTDQYSMNTTIDVGGQRYDATFRSATQVLMLQAGARWSF